MSRSPLYDCVIIGGGPAGLSAALQLARSNRQVIVVDGARGRSTFRQVNHNYLGFPGGVAARDLRALGRQQVGMYPVAFVDDEVSSLKLVRGVFQAELGSSRTVRARSAVLATGVTDDFPDVSGWQDYVGRSLFWCIVCDGYAARGKRVVAVGNHTDAAVTALQFLHFTPTVSLVTNNLQCALDGRCKGKLARHGVELFTGELTEFFGDDGILCGVGLADGRSLAVDFVFSLQGSAPNSALAKGAGASCDQDGYVKVDEEQHTNVPGLFAAGDLSNRHAHQVATAVHEGLTAATAAHHFLLPAWQRG